jgi:hypothetical protein
MVSVLRIDLRDRAIGITVKESVDFVPKRAKVFTCPGEFGSWPLK